MSDQRNKNDKFPKDQDCMTTIVNFLRSTSLDELPQLLNVLKGNMSLVGHITLLEKYIPLRFQEQFTRHEVKPGITGWAQDNGRNNTRWDKKFEMDVSFADNHSSWLDLQYFG
jgi:lipopolysaccharide/colanic/teichoic acid biosynthesis glycosyltransferase